MTYLLDTNVVSELRKTKNGKASPKVLQWMSSANIKEMYLSTITIAELHYGIFLLRHNKDYHQADIIEKWVNEWVLREFNQRIIPINNEIAKIYASLQVPNKKAIHDCLIASTAIYYGMTVITDNTKDFETIDVPLINPFI